MKKSIVISNNAMSLTSNNGKTLNSLFSNFNKDDLIQYFFNRDTPSGTACSNYVRVSFFDLFTFGKKIDIFSSKDRTITENIPEKGLRRYVFSRLLSSDGFYYYKLYARNILYFLFFPFLILTFLRFSSSKFQKGNIFLVGGDYVFPFVLSRVLSRIMNCKLSIYITDDYIFSKKTKGFFAKIYQGALLKEYSRSFSLADNIFVIGDDMKRKYDAFFSVESMVLINATDILNESESSKSYFENSNFVNLTYAGGLHLGRLDKLKELADIVRDINTKFSPVKKLKLNVASFEKPKFEVSHHVNYLGGVESSSVPNLLLSSDFLVHIESTDDKYKEKTKYSVSTKIPEYISSGKPIISMGSKDLASIRLLDSSKLAYNVDSSNVDDFFSYVNSFLKDENSKRSHFDRSRAVFENQFSPDIMKKALYDKLH